MKLVKAIAQGIMQVDDTSIPVYKLEDGTLAAGQAVVIKYLTDGTTTASRHQLNVSNLGKYLPKKMFTQPEFAIESGVKSIRLLTEQELLSLCKAILMATQDGKLGRSWQSAPGRVSRLLLLFAQIGIKKTIEKTLKENPVSMNDSFERHLVRLLNYQC